MSRAIGMVLVLTQVVLGMRVVWRLLRTGGDARILPAPSGAVQAGSVAIIVPVLNEFARLSDCLRSVLEQGDEVGEILVVDGGSKDRTREIVFEHAARDRRLRLIDAGTPPDGWNGKVWGLSVGQRALGSTARWVLTLDADVRPSAALARSLVARADSGHLRLLSVATNQRLSGALEGLLHPAFLATLVYRFGRPGAATRMPARAMANGQCFLIRRDLLHRLGGFQTVRDSLCEDVTLARLAAHADDAVGFYQADDLVEVAMYSGWRDAWRNWPRSLTTRDALFGVAGWLGLLEVLLVQALPLPLALVGWPGAVRRLNLVLLAVRLGMLVGIARAYPSRPLTYWLSPLLDLPAALALWWSALHGQHAWRGRTYIRQKGLIVAA